MNRLRPRYIKTKNVLVILSLILPIFYLTNLYQDANSWNHWVDNFKFDFTKGPIKKKYSMGNLKKQHGKELDRFYFLNQAYMKSLAEMVELNIFKKDDRYVECNLIHLPLQRFTPKYWGMHVLEHRPYLKIFTSIYLQSLGQDINYFNQILTLKKTNYKKHILITTKQEYIKARKICKTFKDIRVEQLVR